MYITATLKPKFHFLFRVALLTALLAGLLITGPVTPVKAIIPDPYTGCVNPGDQTDMPEAECLALVALYNGTTGASWTTNTDWLQTNTPCSWFGVSCSGTNVNQILLTDNNLNGTLPTELGDFSNMQFMYITANPLLTGGIPTELGNLSTLIYLQLYSNALSGSIPASLGGLSNLTDLHLGNNQLTGNIPPELGNLSSLQYLALYGNSLNGSIPPELGDLTNLTYFQAAGNDLTGSIPNELGNMSNLYFLNLGDNQLSGNIPPELGNLSALQYLRLHLNQLTGGIPSALGSLSNLTLLFLNENEISGSVPAELGNLTLLEYFYIGTTNLSGPLPLSLTNLTVLDNFNYLNTNLCAPGDSAFQDWLTVIASVSTSGDLCDLIFADGFESGDTTAWSAMVESPVQIGGGLFSEQYLPPGLGLIVHPKAAAQGSYGLGAIVEDNHPMFVQDDSPTAETQYRARFDLLVKSITADPYKGMGILLGAGTGKTFQVFAGWDGAQHIVVARVGQDDGSWTWTGFYAVPTNDWTLVEIDWAAATGDGNNDGYFSLYLDGVLQETVSSLDNDTVSLDTVRLGPFYVSKSATGIIGFDAFSSETVYPEP